MNNEVVGISAELAIADAFGVYVNPEYRQRGDEEIKNSLMNCVIDAFERERLPIPIKHVAEKQSLIDFELEDGSTLSVKTNKTRLDKVAPQKIGQPTAKTFFEFASKELRFDITETLDMLGLYDTLENRQNVFRSFSQEHIEKLLPYYWDYLFECEHFIHIYNVVDRQERPTWKPKCLVLKDRPAAPAWDREYISFTRSIDRWRTSCSVKYHGVTIGEFEVHQNRNCLKFRFDIKGILTLMNQKII